LALVHRRTDAEVIEEREVKGTDHRNPILNVGRKTGIATDRGHTVDGQRHLNALVVLRVGGIARNATAIGVGEREVDARGHVAIRRCGTHVEAAYVEFTARVQTIVRRRHGPGEALNVPQLRANTQHVTALCGGKKVVHGNESLVGNYRIDIAHVAPQPGELHIGRVFFAVARARWV
jgi:hypothetical protein